MSVLVHCIQSSVSSPLQVFEIIQLPPVDKSILHQRHDCFKQLEISSKFLYRYEMWTFGHVPLSRSNYLNFHAVFDEIWPNNRFWQILDLPLLTFWYGLVKLFLCNR